MEKYFAFLPSFLANDSITILYVSPKFPARSFEKEKHPPYIVENGKSLRGCDPNYTIRDTCTICV